MKHSIKKKIICLILGASFAFSASVLPTVALTPSYAVGKYYKESKYYDRLIDIEATGDERYDVIAVAISQLGYHEGNSEADMGGENKNGNRNFVEYNRIIGAPVDNGEGNGVSYGFEWCAAFVSWCLRQADVPKTSAVTEISCVRMVEWLRARGIYKSRSGGYTPKPADLIFFRPSLSSTRAGHVGLVVGTDSTYVYTIEGNNGGCVDYHRYKKTDALILGYGTPDYDTVEGVKYDFELKTDYFEPGIYVTTDDLNLRTGASTSYPSLGKIKKGTRLEIFDAVGDWARVSYGGKSGYCSLDYLKLAEPMKYKVSYDANGGTNAPAAQTKEHAKKLSISLDIPQREAYVFIGWSTDKNAVTAELSPGAYYKADKTATLYAVWKYVGYTVSFYGDDGELIKTEIYDLGDKIVPPEAPEKSGGLLFRYEFAGWSPEIPDAVSKNVSFFATYDKKFIFDTTEKDEETNEPVTEESLPIDTEDETTEQSGKAPVAKTNVASVLAGIVSAVGALCAAWFIKRK